MKYLFFFLWIVPSLCHSQYTYWVYDGSNVTLNGPIVSMKGRISSDSTFETLGAIYDNGQRVYISTHSLLTGERLQMESSDYFDFNYFAGSGYGPLSYHFLNDGGYCVLHANPENGGWGYPDYIRLDANLDTIWTDKPRLFNDPLGASYENLPMFALPLWDGSLLSVLSTSVSIPDGNFYRFLRHDAQTGDIISDHLWAEEEVNVDGTVYAVGLFGGVQTDADSVLIWGNYGRHGAWQDPFQTFMAKFDLHGHLGGFKLFDFGSALATDGAGAVYLEGDTLNYLYFNGDSLEEPDNVISLRSWRTLRLQRINVQDLNIISESEFSIPNANIPTSSGGVSSLIKKSDGSYLAVIMLSNALDQSDSVQFFLMNINDQLDLNWIVNLGNDYYVWYNYMTLESPDGGIITGGGLSTTSSEIQHDYFIKLDACGYTVPSDCPEFVNVQEGQVVKDGFKVWPNPSSGRVEAIVPQGAQQLQVFDMQGRCVFKEALYYPRQTWNFSFLPRGVYTLAVRTEAGATWQQRWVKVD